MDIPFFYKVNFRIYCKRDSAFVLNRNFRKKSNGQR